MPASWSTFLGRTGTPPVRCAVADRTEIVRALSAAFPRLLCYADSACAVPGGLLVAARDGLARKIVAAGALDDFAGETAGGDARGYPSIEGVRVRVCDADAPNLAALRARVPWLRPVLAAGRPSVGLGDRLGLATPGHLAAGAESGFFLVLAQQSIREMERTARTARQVLDEAVFGAFQCGYDRGFGSDADHLKTPADVDVTADAGFNSFTIDPSAHVDDAVGTDSPARLAARFEQLVADGVPGARDWRRKYVGQEFRAGSLTIRFDEVTLLRAAIKYGRAVAHVEAMARHIARRVEAHELELSVDETALPTSAAEHLFIVHELKERGVRLHSLAPRFVGEFEKGVDYKGGLKTFEDSLREHHEIACHYGPYKLSVHSGSDKFRIYPIVARVTGGQFHLKTAGTSYLEALRVVVRREPEFFREIAEFCRARYNAERRTYHVSAKLEQVRPTGGLDAAALEREYLDRDPGRQVLHVCFGVVLTFSAGGRPKFRERLLDLLNREADLYVEVLKKHIGRHLEGLCRGGSPTLP